MTEKIERIQDIENQHVDTDKPIVIPEITGNATAAPTDSQAELSQRDIEAQAERARKKAAYNESMLKKAKSQTKKSSKFRRGYIGQEQREASYSKTIARIQTQLSASDRLFSQFIHAKPIEKISEFFAVTIARPNALLTGSIAAFILTLFTYTVSKQIGYTLSGYETIIAFVVGWVIGIVYDYLRVLITGNKD